MSRSRSDRRPAPPHVALMVQNVSVAADNRLRKQVEDLLAAGYRVSVVTREAPENAPLRHWPGLRLMEYPAPADGDSTLTHLREYAVSLARQLPTRWGCTTSSGSTYSSSASRRTSTSRWRGWPDDSACGCWWTSAT